MPVEAGRAGAARVAVNAVRTAGRLRLCVEAVNMLLATQNQMATALRSLSDEQTKEKPMPSRKPAA